MMKAIGSSQSFQNKPSQRNAVATEKNSGSRIFPAKRTRGGAVRSPFRRRVSPSPTRLRSAPFGFAQMQGFIRPFERDVQRRFTFSSPYSRAQSLRGIDAHRAPRGKQTREERDNCHD